MRARLAVAGLFLLGALVLTLLRTGRPDSPASAAHALGAASDGARPGVELAAVVEETPVEPGPGAPAREEAAAPVPTGLVRGRLVEEEGGAPLSAVRIVLLASPGDRVAETLRTEDDGSFTTERAFPRSVVRAWVRDPATGIVLARHEAPFDPELGEWRIPVPGQTSGARGAGALFEPGEAVLHGRVVTLGGRGVEGALVKALPFEGEGAAVTETTEEGGSFRLHGLRAQGYRVLALGSFAASAAHELVLEAGENQAGELVLPVDDSPGPIRGRLVAEPGGEDPFGVLLLRDPRSGKELAVTSEFKLFGNEEDGQSAFEILGAPPGEYELSVLSVDGRRYIPLLQHVAPPCDGVEFRAEASLGHWFVLAVRDQHSGTPIEECVALGRIHGQWYGNKDREPAFSQLFDRWIVYAPGYRPARGDLAHAVPTGTDEQGHSLARIEVGLSPGHGGAILFKDAQGTRLVVASAGGFFGDGLAGVQVYADGKPVAESDAEGLALIDLAHAPELLTFARPGWRVAGEHEEDGIRFVQMIRE